MISIYTDASVKKHQSATGGCVVLTDSNMMGYDVFDLGEVAPQVAEIRACVRAIQYAQEVCPNMCNEVVELHCDNATVVKTVGNDNYVGRLSDELKPLRELIGKFKIKVKYIKGHQTVQANPNIVVDSILRAQRKELV